MVLCLCTLLGLGALSKRESGQTPPMFTPKVVGSRVIIEDWKDGLKNWQRVDPNFPSSAIDGRFPDGAESNLRLRSISDFYFPSRRSSNAETGIAVTKAFDLSNLESISFKVAGGNDGKTYVALVVDGKEVLKANGDGSFNPVEVNWAVTPFKGKQGCLEVVDQSTDPKFGWVALVGEVSGPSRVDFGTSISIRTLCRIPSTAASAGQKLTDGTIPKFAQYSALYSDMEANRLLDGMRREFSPEFLRVLDREYELSLMKSVEFKSGLTADHYADGLSRLCERALSDCDFNASRFQKQYLAARAVCLWVVEKSSYDADPETPRHSERLSANYILNLDSLCSVCSGLSNVVQSITNALQPPFRSECFYVGGWQRQLGDGPVTWDSNHAWNAFRFCNGVMLPADVTSARCVDQSLLQAPRSLATKQYLDRWILPVSREWTELFYARNFGFLRRDGAANQFPDRKETDLSPFLSMYFSEWSDSRTSDLAAEEHRLIYGAR